MATKASLNTKTNEIKGEIPNITNLTTTSALNAAENKTPSVSNLVKKNDYNTKITEIEKKLKVTSTKGLTKDLMDKFSILNGAKHFSSGIFQNYLVFMPAIKYIKHFSGTTRIES